MECVHKSKGITAVDRLLEPLRRWVFGSGGGVGYVLAHPKVGDYLQRSRFAAVATQLRHGFADWGSKHCIALNEGQLAPEEASVYCLQFLPEHLRQAKASPDAYMLMLENGWRLGWEKFEGGQRGFASAAQAAFTALREDKSDLRVGARWRCALTLSSIRSLGENVPSPLLIAAVEKGTLSIRQAAYFGELKGACEESVRLFVGLAASTNCNPQLSFELTVSALEMAKMIGNERERARALAELAPHLQPEMRHIALEAAIRISGDGLSWTPDLGPLAKV
jgi:hypothetical protein